MDVERVVIDHLARRLPMATVAADVPRSREGPLVTVERTGGGSANQLDSPTLAIQSWAPSRALASALAHDVDRAMAELPREHPEVSGVERESLANWPDPDSRSPRYQGVYHLTTSA